MPSCDVVSDELVTAGKPSETSESEPIESKHEEEEEIDDDLVDPRQALFALQIQADLKDHQTKKEVKLNTAEELPSTATETISRKGKIETDFGDKKMKEKYVEERAVFLNYPASAEQQKAAAKIQAGFKGMKTRRKAKKKKLEVFAEDEAEEEAEEEAQKEAEEIAVVEEEAEAVDETKEKVNESEKITEDISELAHGTATDEEPVPAKDNDSTEAQIGISDDVQIVERHEIVDDTKILDKPTDEIATAKETPTEDVKVEEVTPTATALETKELAPASHAALMNTMEEAKVTIDPTGSLELAHEEGAELSLEECPEEETVTADQTRVSTEKTPNLESEPIETKQEEEIDIDLEDPEVADAALKIQAGFKGHQARKEVKKLKEDREGGEPDESATSAGEVQPEEQVEHEIESKSETCIESREGPEGTEAKLTQQEIESVMDGKGEEEEIDIDLEDPEVADAALKIQAGFKGHKARKEVKAMKEEKDQTEDVTEPTEPAKQTESPEPIEPAKPNETDEPTESAEPIEPGKPTDPAELGEPAEPAELAEPPGTTDPTESIDPTVQPGPEEVTTEMLIEGGAEGQDQDLRPLSHTEDDGYITPEFTGTSFSSSMQSSPIKSAKLELTGKPALLHDPHEDILMTLASQESVTDSMIDDSSEITQSADEINFALGIHEQNLDEINEEAGSSKLSSLVTVANAEDLDVNKEPDEHSSIVTVANAEDLEINKETDEPSSLVTVDNAEDIEVTKELNENEDIDVENAKEVEAVDAVPLEQHVDHPQVKELTKEDVLVEEKELPKESITLYHSKGSYNSEKVLIYLYERGIKFSSFLVDLSKGEQFSKWFLKINPKGEVPVLTIKDHSRPSSDPRSLRIIAESSRIMHSLESKFEDNLPSPRLVPLSDKVEAYQYHVYFTAMFEQVNKLDLVYKSGSR